MENAAFASGARMAISPVAYPGGMRVSVLAVEEDPYWISVLMHMLQRRGYQVTAKASPEEGLRALRNNPEGFDLVMTVVRTQGPGIDGFELLKHATDRYPVILFSGFESPETVLRGIHGGACDFLTKPVRDEEVRNIWQHVVRRRITAPSGAAANADARSGAVVVRQDDTTWMRGSARLDDSDGSKQQMQRRTIKNTKFYSWPELHASFVQAAEQLRGTEDYCLRGIINLLEVQGIELTTEQVTSHLEKYRRDCLTNHLSAMPMTSSYQSNISKNYSRPGSSEFYMRPQGATNINQTNLLSNGASPAGFGILGQSYRASHVGHLYNNDNRHGNANGNGSGKYGNGYDYYYGNENDNANANGCHNGNCGGGVPLTGSMISASLRSNLAHQVHQVNISKEKVHQVMPQGIANGHDGLVPNANMVSVSVPSNLAQQAHQVMPQGFGNGRGGLEADGNMFSASLSSNVAQPVQQEMPNNSSFPSSMIRTIDNPNSTRQQEFPRVSGLRYDGSTGGISMLPCPVDDGEDLLRSYLDENDVMQNTVTTDMRTQEMHGDVAAGQTSASQPQGLTNFLSWESTNGNGIPDISGESGIVTDWTMEWQLTEEEMKILFNSQVLFSPQKEK